MPADSGDDLVLAELVQSLTERIQRGEELVLDSLVAEYPQFAERLRRLLPTIQAVAQVGLSSEAAACEARAGDRAAAGGTIGDYEIVREIGRGGMGVVYEARQVSLSRRVALKVLPFAAALDPRALARFKQESLAAAQLDHPHIVHIHNVGLDRGVHYYAMQYIEGQSLAQVIEELQRVEGVEKSKRSKGNDSLASRGRKPPNDVGHNELGVRNSEFGAANGLQGATQQPPATPNSAHRTPNAFDQSVDGGRSPALRTTVAQRGPFLSTDRDSNRAEFYRGVARLGIQAAEALDYAHEHGVLHRDVKPGNLLLDEAGKLFITDFGLARVENETNLTRTGDLMGTLRYMSPEQATAARGLVDQRSDVYSLGATLYELLMLRPVFTSEDRAILLKQIAEDDPAPLRKRDRSIPGELETIVLKCLEKEPARRYATAHALAGDLTRFLEHKPIAARRSSIGERLRKWCRRHKPVVSAVALVLFAAWLFSLVAVYDHSERRRTTTALVNEALEEAALRHGEARANADDLSAWELAIAAAGHAADLAHAGPIDLQTRQRMSNLQAELNSQAGAAKVRVEQAERDRTMLRALKAIRLEASILWGESGNSAFAEAFHRAFRDYGIDLAELSVNDAALRISDSALSGELVTAIDCWAIWRPLPGHPEQSARLLEITRAADPDDTWRNQLRTACGVIEAEPEQELPLLLELARSTDAPSQPVEYLTDISRRLAIGSPAEAIRLLQAARREHPSDFWVNYALGYAYFRTITPGAQATFDPQKHSTTAGFGTLNAIAQQVRYSSVATALNPSHARAHFNLGTSLAAAGAMDEAIEEFRETIRLDPRVGGAFNNLGNALLAKGDQNAALEAFREGVRISPNDPFVHNNLGSVLKEKGDCASAISHYRQALELRPDYAEARANLGNALRDAGDVDGALVELRRALQLMPDSPDAHTNLGIALSSKGDVEGAIAEHRWALELKPDHVRARNNLGFALSKRGDVDGAINEYRRALELAPNSAVIRANLAQAEQLVAINARFAAVSSGAEQRTGAAEWAELAEFALSFKHLPGLAAEWYRRAFTEDPTLCEDQNKGHRYNAACAAALAGSAENDDALRDNEWADWRGQARDWLAADLRALEKLVGDGGAGTNDAVNLVPKIRATLAHWQSDPDLAGIRDPERVAPLAEAERTLCEELWCNVQSLATKLARAAPGDTPIKSQP